MQQRYLLVSILLGGYCFPAYAQDAGSILSDKLRFDDIPEMPPLSSATTENEPVSLPVATAFEPTVLIRSLRFNGNIDLLTEAQRMELSSGVEGTEIGMAGIRALTESVNTKLVQNGYLLAQAIIPPQDTTNGVLAVSIFEAPLDDLTFKFDKSVRTKNKMFMAVTERHIDRERFNKNDLDTALRVINDFPGVNARSRLAQGKLAGTSKIIVDVSQEPLITGSFNADNFGHPSIGRIQAAARIELADITGNGDLGRLGVEVSKGHRYASASLIKPVSSRELLATFDYGYLHYDNIELVDEVAKLRGSAHYTAIGLMKQAIRSRDHRLAFSAMVNGKALRDFSRDGKVVNKHSVSGVLGIVGELSDTLGGGGANVVSASWTFGKLKSTEIFGGRGVNSQGQFHRLNAYVARLQKLPGNFNLYASLSGQWANKDLDSSESFSLGGQKGVRSLAAGEARGYKGISGRAELQYNTPFRLISGKVRIAGSIDSGRVWENTKFSGILPLSARKGNSYSVSSMGVNASFRHKNVDMSIGWAQGFARKGGRRGITGTRPDHEPSRQKFWLSGSIKF